MCLFFGFHALTLCWTGVHIETETVFLRNRTEPAQVLWQFKHNVQVKVDTVAGIFLRLNLIVVFCSCFRVAHLQCFGKKAVIYSDVKSY